MPCRNVGMIVTCLRALAIVGERINIDEELGGEIVKDRIGDVDVGLQTEAGMPHKRDLRCQTEAVKARSSISGVVVAISSNCRSIGSIVMS